jgi:hypothetical protein
VRYLDRLGWPVELIEGRPILSFFRLLIHTRKIVRKWEAPKPVAMCCGTASTPIVEAQYVKLPIPVKATQWFKNGDHPHDYDSDEQGVAARDRRRLEWEGEVVRYFRHPEYRASWPCEQCNSHMHDHGWIDTREGGHRVCPGDWILTGIEGERWPVKPEIFTKTYVLAPEPPK